MMMIGRQLSYCLPKCVGKRSESRRLLQVGPSHSDPLQKKGHAMNTASNYQRKSLEEVVASFSVPQVLRDALNEHKAEVLPAQIWRAEWAGKTMLVLVLAVGDAIQAAPVALDVPYADGTCSVVPEEDSPLGVPLVIWPQLRRSLPHVVFDRCLGSVAHHLPSDVLKVPISQLIELSPNDPVRLYRALLEDTIQSLTIAQWNEEGSGQLVDLIRSLGIPGIAEALAVPPQRALALWRGQAALNRGEAERIGVVTGESPDTLLAANPSLPEELVASLEQPLRHCQVRAFAEKRGIGRSDAYREIAFQTWALAARQTGERSHVRWDLRLDTYFAAVLHDE